MEDQPIRTAMTSGKAVKQALNLRMDVGTIQRLKLHALVRGTTASDLVAQLVETHLRDVAMKTQETGDSG